MYKFIHVNAGTLADAVATLGQGKTAVIAGGTDLIPYMKGMCSPNPPTTLVNIKTVTPSLNYIKVDGGTLKIGALTSLSDIAASSKVVGGWNVQALAVKTAANPEVRNMGTIGGNICQKPRCLYFRNEMNAFNCLRKTPRGGLLCPEGCQYLPFHLRRCRWLHRCLPLRYRPCVGSIERFHRHQQEDLGRR